MTEPTAKTILEEAGELITGERREQYGNYRTEAYNIAECWSMIVGLQIEPRHVPLMMVALKLVREAHKPSRDNRVDACGYMALADKLVCDESEPVRWHESPLHGMANMCGQCGKLSASVYSGLQPDNAHIMSACKSCCRKHDAELEIAN